MIEFYDIGIPADIIQIGLDTQSEEIVLVFEVQRFADGCL